MMWTMLSVLWILNFVTPCASAQNVLQLKRLGFASVVGGGDRRDIFLFLLETDVCFSAS